MVEKLLFKTATILVDYVFHLEWLSWQVCFLILHSVFSLQILHKKNPDKIKIEKAEAQR